MENKRQPLPLESDKPADSQAALAQTGSADAGQDLEQRVIAALRTCYDPEIPVNIHELGLIYKLAVDSSGKVNIQMTLTSPACPVAGSLPGEVQAKVQAVPGVTAANVELVWDPPWDKDRMSEAAMLELGLF
jgi:FeS assembly SUF system protein